ncbi:2-hydroxyisoflavanone dehydratase-like, partial [Carica papaya]|uniref:2-hydroxyisoflavanone dehydratase-like n=1 Tax=Carica papaya TaxID=3649 RepID=UPI000B8CD5B2
MGSVDDKEVVTELLPYLIVYKNGSVDRLLQSPIVPHSLEDPETGVSSKDIAISQSPPISARIYLPKSIQPHQKLSILVYYHGGGFSFDSPFSFSETNYMNRLVSHGRVLAVSIDYRLAPEHPLPIAYEDGWAALRWVASHSAGTKTEPWISNHGNFDRVFIGGDSAGANLAHNILMRAGSEELPGGVKILGGFLTHPYFWGSKPIGEENGNEHEKKLPYRLWEFLYPTASGGMDSPLINPIGPGAPSLAGLGCRRLLVSVAGRDLMKYRGIGYYKGVKKVDGKEKLSWYGEDEDHAF